MLLYTYPCLGAVSIAAVWHAVMVLYTYACLVDDEFVDSRDVTKGGGGEIHKPSMLLGAFPDLNVQLHAGNKHSAQSQTIFKCLTVS